jgi:hypothetical protein
MGGIEPHVISENVQEIGERLKVRTALTSDTVDVGISRLPVGCVCPLTLSSSER